VIHDALCKTFCANVEVTPVPIGFAVRTPHMKPDGDFASFYIRRNVESDLYRVEDDGCTVADLEASGFDFDKESRFEAFTSILADHDVAYDDHGVLLSTPYMPLEALAESALSFSYLMARLPDLLLIVGSRVQRSFKEDLADLIETQFGQVCSIARNAPVDPGDKDYIVDFVIRSPDGRILAVFAGSSEMKALESLLFWEHTKNREGDALKSVVVLEGARPTAIKERTLSRVMNSGLILATLDGGLVNVGEKLRMTLGNAA
jgi:hypothetical protein